MNPVEKVEKDLNKLAEQWGEKHMRRNQKKPKSKWPELIGTIMGVALGVGGGIVISNAITSDSSHESAKATPTPIPTPRAIFKGRKVIGLINPESRVLVTDTGGRYSFSIQKYFCGNGASRYDSNQSSYKHGDAIIIGDPPMIVRCNTKGRNHWEFTGHIEYSEPEATPTPKSVISNDMQRALSYPAGSSRGSSGGPVE